MAPTIETLRKMSDRQLSNYFYQNARYFGEEHPKYGIRLSSIIIWSDDTLDLRKKFFAAVRTPDREDQS